MVIHNLGTGKIEFICGKLSKRKVGDESLIDIEVMTDKVEEVIYSKMNFDGRLVKSISVPIKEEERIVGILCINYDISLFEQVKKIAENLLCREDEGAQPEYLFKNDWQERLHKVVHNYLYEKQWKFEQLNRAQKKEVVYYLYQSGVFSEKNSADYVAEVLNMGRATIFNYLKEWRK